MLLHLSSRRSFWFCNYCRLEMPNLDGKRKNSQKNAVQINSSSLQAAITANKSLEAVAAI